MNKNPQIKNLPTISFVTPTYNSAPWIKNYLQSIRKQDYPQSKIEILFVDGGSIDDTLKLAKKYKIRVVKNKLILGDPGFAVGGEKAKGDFMVFMGHDNELVQKSWIRLMLRPMLEDEKIVAAFPHLDNKKTDTWLTRYANRFTDPGNHFVYGYANNPLTFNKVYGVVKKTKDWVVFDFKLKDHPVLEFEQGFMIRKKGYYRDKSTWYCGILAVLSLIKDKKMIAYVPRASNYHTTLNKGVGQFIKKHRWAIDYNLDKRKTFGIYKDAFGLKARRKYISLDRKIKMFFYPFYGISFIMPCARALYMFLKDGEREWLYHPFITFISAFIIWQEAVKIKIFRKNPTIDRY
ncbi:MAG: glycosyltransferase family 2 protein [Candidatus Shapirobacteria bacterium]